jgi:hypothetical protein
MKNIAFLSLFVLISCSNDSSINSEYAIYSKLISSFKSKSIAIKQMTSPPIFDSDYQELHTDMPSLELETFNDFTKKLKTIDTLENIFNSKKKIILISQKEIQIIFSQQNKDGWDTFYKKYGKTQGITSLSQIGFNNNKTQALVSDWTQSWMLSGSGYYSLYEFKRGRWILKYRKLYGIS